MSGSTTALVFVGQGSHFLGMADGLAASVPGAPEILARTDEALGFPLSQVMRAGPYKQLQRTSIAQPAVLCVSVLLHRLVDADLEPAVLGGHSLGEFSALVAAGSLELEDALRLVHTRGLLMEEAFPPGAGGMLAVRCDSRRRLRAWCREEQGSEVLTISGHNGGRQYTVAGHGTALTRLERRLETERVPCTRLDVSTPFHSPLLRSAEEKFRLDPTLSRLRPPRAPVLSNRDGRTLVSPHSLGRRLAGQITRPVRWDRCLATLRRLGIQRVVELGPRSVLAGSMRRELPGVPIVSITSAAIDGTPARGGRVRRPAAAEGA